MNIHSKNWNLISMKSTHNNVGGRDGRLTQKKLKTKPVLIVLGLLLLGNMLWFIAWLVPNGPTGGNEVVATVGKEEISVKTGWSRWKSSMEKKHYLSW